jgi:hypothetical protein
MHTKRYTRQDAIEALHTSGFEAAAGGAPYTDRDAAVCHLCHTSYSQHLHDCICPHWLVLPWPSMERMQAVLGTYDIAAILHFLLIYTKPKTSRRRPESDYALTASASDTRRHVLVKAQRRSWAFSMATEPGATSSLSFQLTATSSTEFQTAFLAKDGDVALLRRFAQAW